MRHATRFIEQEMASKVLKVDIAWGSALFAITAFLLIPATHQLFVEVSQTHVYLMAFAKFSLLATMGELLALRIINSEWVKPKGLCWRALVWGLLGALIALVFYLYATGVSAALERGLLPTFGKEGMMAKIVFAFFTSILMNLLFAPTFMAFHRVTDTYIDMADGKITRIMQLELTDVLNQIDWNSFIKIVICRTIPLFWIPAHTTTFLLPPEHRVLAAAFLSIALGAILALSKRGQHKEVSTRQAR